MHIEKEGHHMQHMPLRFILTLPLHPLVSRPTERKTVSVIRNLLSSSTVLSAFLPTAPGDGHWCIAAKYTRLFLKLLRIRASSVYVVVARRFHMGKTHELVLNLRRSDPNEAWGFSLVGGADVKTPLIVTRVSFGCPVQNVLQRGDIITKVGNYDARDIRHQDAQTLFKNAGTCIQVVVQSFKRIFLVLLSIGHVTGIEGIDAIDARGAVCF
ncbi:unnamed protein product [Callosobruchus maculatus]|uniref:PDZ domain-containing protein n=1 Tax=Callosobruchus maculatus TaxID=64391 RepID=A0A653BR53_CALMS|nr:unnamed protein product [Callosobruchus maculatus]